MMSWFRTSTHSWDLSVIGRYENVRGVPGAQRWRPRAVPNLPNVACHRVVRPRRRTTQISLGDDHPFRAVIAAPLLRYWRKAHQGSPPTAPRQQRVAYRSSDLRQSRRVGQLQLSTGQASRHRRTIRPPSGKQSPARSCQILWSSAPREKTTAESATTRNKAAKTGIAKSSPGHGTLSPSPIQNTPNAESTTPTANLSVFSGTRVS